MRVKEQEVIQSCCSEFEVKLRWFRLVSGCPPSILLYSDLGFQQLQEEFVHWDFAVLLDAVEVLHSLGRGLAEQGEGHEQLARPAGILLVLGSLVVLQGLVEHILELLHCIHIFNVHGVWEKRAEKYKHINIIIKQTL